MLRSEIQVALEAAAKISFHREFVIAGSLSVLGYKEVPPEMMSLSIDIDFFPLGDQAHVQEVAQALGEDSEFHESHGYYLDPISVNILVLPVGWMERLVQIQLGTVQAYFLDVNDTAISKYVRSADNDYRWIDAGYEAGILDLEKIDARARFGIDYPGDDDQRRVRNGIESHRAAMRPDGMLVKNLLSFLRSDAIKHVARLSTEDDSYSGEIIWLDEGRAVQMIDFGKVVVHRTQLWNETLKIGQAYLIGYEDGLVNISKIPCHTP